jgi:hypothetical protein
MPKQGRDLEQLVEELERLFAGTGLTVASPDYVVGQNSGDRREIDVSVRGRMGSFDVFAMFECRDRGKGADVTWIEQIATKRMDVSANVAVAVSSSGFSAAARRSAGRLGVELRTLKRTTVSDLIGTVLPREFRHIRVEFGLKAVNLQLAEEAASRIPPASPLLVAREGVNLNTLMLRAKNTGERVPLTQAASSAVAQSGDAFVRPFLGAEAAQPFTLEANYAPGDRFEFETAEGAFDLSAIFFRGTARARITPLAPSAATEYRVDEGTVLARSITVDLPPEEGGQLTFHELHHPEGIRIAVRANARRSGP